MNPFRFRDMSAQEIIDCDLVECCVRERQVNDALGVFER